VSRRRNHHDRAITEDLKKITVPVQVIHGDDDHIVPTTIPRRYRQNC
jgi:pimeloyl-ACP methyl ester carboxylesterase